MLSLRALSLRSRTHLPWRLVHPTRKLHVSRIIRKGPQGSDPANSSLQSTDLLTLYRGLVTRGDIEYDEDQVRAVMRLRRLTRELEDYVPNLVSGHAAPVVTPGLNWWAEEKGATGPDAGALLVRKDMAREFAELDTPRGVILVAPPGRGKTFLLDMWFSTLPTRYKVRKHYSTLTLELYRAVWEETQSRATKYRAGVREGGSVGRVKWSAAIKARWRALFDKGEMSLTSQTGAEENLLEAELPMAQILAARLLLRQGWLLQIDELQLLDIGIATILSDILGHFWRMGGVVVATSNKVPGELYKNGLGAERVRGFVDALEARCDVVRVGGERDWRREDEGGDRRGWYLVGEEGFEEVVREVVKGRTEASTTLNIFNRHFHIPQIYLSPDPSQPPIARLTFSHLCNTALGTADYTTLASTFSTHMLTDIPILRLSTKDQARRFIMLIDALFEARVKVLCLAEAADGLFFPNELAVRDGEEGNDRTMMEEALSERNVTYRPNVSMYEQEPVSKPRDEGPRRVDGREEKFAYARATSRLVQMTSSKYEAIAVWQPLAQVHQP